MIDERLVSIALCTYNGAKHLAEQLDSVVAQTYKNIEVIVVDDCSTDDTFNILEWYARQYAAVKIYRNQKNVGFIANFERAVKLCSGALIALCDQDDIWHPEKIALQVNAIGDHLFIYHDSEFIQADGSRLNRKMSDILNLYRGSQPGAFLFFNCVSGHAILMKRELLDVALPLKAGYFHDWWLAYVATNVGSIDYLPQCLVQYRQHDKSDTNILGLAREKDKYKFTSLHKLQRIHGWLALCAAFPKNRDQEFIDAFYRAFTGRMNSYVSVKLSLLLYRHRAVIFYIRKKSVASKLNYMYQQLWGAKLKKT